MRRWGHGSCWLWLAAAPACGSSDDSAATTRRGWSADADAGADATRTRTPMRDADADRTPTRMRMQTPTDADGDAPTDMTDGGDTAPDGGRLCGPYPAAPAGSGQTCDVRSCGLARPVSASPLPSAGETTYAPVCGCDGVTYDNDCGASWRARRSTTTTCGSGSICGGSPGSAARGARCATSTAAGRCFRTCVPAPGAAPTSTTRLRLRRRQPMQRLRGGSSPARCWTTTGGWRDHRLQAGSAAAPPVPRRRVYERVHATDASSAPARPARGARPSARRIGTPQRGLVCLPASIPARTAACGQLRRHRRLIEWDFCAP